MEQAQAREGGGLTRNKIIAELTRSPHGALVDYLPVCQQAAREESEFLARLIAWNQRNGQVRDSKVALPVITLSVPSPEFPEDLVENSVAHLALLSPRDLVRACRFAKDIGTVQHGNQVGMRGLVRRYLRAREGVPEWWDRTVAAHRESVKTLYAMFHVARPAWVGEALFLRKYAPGSLLDAIQRLGKMPAAEAAEVIVGRRLTYLVAAGAMGRRIKEPAVLRAILERMSPTEFVTNARLLDRLGVRGNPELREAYEAAAERAGASKEATYKATRAAEAVGGGELRARLREVQERQIEALAGVDGNWLVLGDKSPSMKECIEAARQVAATLARAVRGRVHLVFFDSDPTYFDATGRSYAELLEDTKRIVTGGGTSIGVGLDYALRAGLEIDGIAVVSDAKENTPPMFVTTFERATVELGKQVPVYLYRFAPARGMSSGDDLADSMSGRGFALHEFDLRGGFDYASLPGIVATMRTNPYALSDTILTTPLLALHDALHPQRPGAAPADDEEEVSTATRRFR